MEAKNSISIELKEIEDGLNEVKQLKKDYLMLDFMPSAAGNAVWLYAVCVENTMLAECCITSDSKVEKRFGTDKYERPKKKEKIGSVYVWLVGLLSVVRKIKTQGCDVVNITLEKDKNTIPQLHLYGMKSESNKIYDFGCIKSNRDVQKVYLGYGIKSSVN